MAEDEFEEFVLYGRPTAITWSQDSSKLLFGYFIGETYEYKVWVFDIETQDIIILDEGDAPVIKLSPNGTDFIYVQHVQYPVVGSKRELYLSDFSGNKFIQLTENPDDDDNPFWSPDGTMIAFRGVRNGDRQIMIMEQDGSNQKKVIEISIDIPRNKGAPFTLSDNLFGWSPDGKRLLFVMTEGDQFNMYTVNIDGTDKKLIVEDVWDFWYVAWQPSK